VAKLETQVQQIAGRACPLRGDDIDTDRIIPARYLKCVVFDGLGTHVFADDRAQLKERGQTHPFDDPHFAEARLLLVNKNFGCGSSREHAPQALLRRGFQAFVGASFAEIFFGNCVALGLPCVTLAPADLAKLFDAVELDPAQVVVLDLAALTVACRAGTFAASMPEGARSQLLGGSWNATAVLLEAGPAIERTAGTLPYVEGFAG